jgi:hypothetical protein
VHNKQAKKKRFYHIEKQQQRDKCKEEKNGGWGDTRTTCHKKKTQTHKKRKSVNKKKKTKRIVVYMERVKGRMLHVIV